MEIPDAETRIVALRGRCKKTGAEGHRGQVRVRYMACYMPKNNNPSAQKSEYFTSVRRRKNRPTWGQTATGCTGVSILCFMADQHPDEGEFISTRRSLVIWIDADSLRVGHALTRIYIGSRTLHMAQDAHREGAFREYQHARLISGNLSSRSEEVCFIQKQHRVRMELCMPAPLFVMTIPRCWLWCSRYMVF